MHKRWKDRLLTLLFPHKCFLCGRTLAGTGWLCEKCVLPETDGLCLGCGKKRDGCVCGGICYDGATASLWYQEGVRRGIHRFKYDGRWYYTAFLGELMARRVQEDFPDFSFDLVTYVPMHPKKRRARGYCQSALLAREVGAGLGLPVEGTLRHTGNRGVQAEQKTTEARKDNAKRSFAAGEKNLAGLRVLLVDDVLTTGSTASRCAELLKELGARSVHVVAAATTP